MICTQTADPAAHNGRILLASDLLDAQAAAQEISDWLHTNHYRFAAQTRPLLVYADGVCIRHWVQAEPQPFVPSDARMNSLWGRGSLLSLLSRQIDKPRPKSF